MKTTTKFTVLHRTLHWVMALAMMILFATGFLRMTWMSKSTVVSVLSETAETKSLLKDQMVGIAKSIQAPMWEWHKLFAHIMIISIVVRIVYMLMKGIRFPRPFGAGISATERLQGMVYVYFYAFVLVQGATGIIMEKGLFQSFQDTAESIHKLGLYLFPIFIVLHLAGIVLAEHTTKKGIVSNMIGGDNS